jgi:hypothetical protein
MELPLNIHRYTALAVHAVDCYLNRHLHRSARECGCDARRIRKTGTRHRKQNVYLVKTRNTVRYESGVLYGTRNAADCNGGCVGKARREVVRIDQGTLDDGAVEIWSRSASESVKRGFIAADARRG